MKNFRILAVTALCTLLPLSSNAQPKGNWHDRMMSEKIAFITMELELTPEEAQVFWPVYNQIAKEKGEAQKKVRGTYRALNKALEEGTASDKEIDKLLNDYLGAKQAQKEMGKDDADRYRKVLSSKKTAMLFVAEENFRKHHIRSMKGGQHNPAQGGKPGQQSGKPGTKR